MPQVRIEANNNVLRRYSHWLKCLYLQQNDVSKIALFKIKGAKPLTDVILEPTEITTSIAAMLDQEKRRIACELHDDAGQMLTVISLRLRQLERRLPSLSNAASTAIYDELSEVCDMVERIQDSLRRLAHSLYPAPLEHFSLPSALQSLLKEACAGSAMSYKVIHPPDFQRLSMEIEVNIYRIVQEAVTNILKHAKASLLTITLTTTAQSLVVEIADDGIGFRPSDSKALTGLGMRSMTERAILIAAHLSINTNPGDGTHLTLTVPLTDVKGVE